MKGEQPTHHRKRPSRPPPRTLDELTPKQRELALHVASGLAYKEIAERMGYASEQCVKALVVILRRRIGAPNGVTLAAWTAAAAVRQEVLRRLNAGQQDELRLWLLRGDAVGSIPEERAICPSARVT